MNTSYENPAYEYGKIHEDKLWKEFSAEMNSDNWSKWFYSESKRDNRPADLGYFIGYMITKSFYEKEKDKDLAVKKIIEVTDYDQFLKDSGYAKKFKK